ncbi:Scr1 family TA system antitoxin-like transcriptional regulator [Actinokineospora inagensis]|uniref:Scr1 family TA system antitoxin-like transcriptional regulator n=1 Tax=Actinokineospora inagensis TaxID=103730 RepID=UPI00041527BF|nr:Scr1 family TA system antitoxin-like transcriptional regulator [Actinokineospora inagensis]
MSGSSLRSMVVGGIVQRLIGASGRTQSAVAAAGEVQATTLSRFTRGTRGLSEGELSVLAWRLGVTARHDRRMLVETNRDRDRTEWWLRGGHRSLLDQAHEVIRDNTLAIVSYSPHEIPAQLRPTAQRPPVPGRYYLGRPAVVSLVPAGGREQIEHLITLSARSGIEIVVVEPHRHAVPFHLLHLASGRNVVRIDINDSALYLEHPDDITRFEQLVNTISLNADGSTLTALDDLLSTTDRLAGTG